VAAAIEVEHVSKRFRLYRDRNQSLKATLLRRGRATFDAFQALDDVSVSIKQGETFGFIGENGSGKSTLLKCIARILEPDAGRIAVTGKVSALLELGAGFHPELSGRENVYLNGSILGLSRRQLDQRFDDIVDFADLAQFIDSPVKNYSSGMYVRLGFSVAINVDPDVLLVDEVLAVGDESFQRRCGEKFAELRQSGKTIVIVSHGLASIRTMCDRAMWLDHGQAKCTGPAGEVIDEYLAGVHHVQTDRKDGTQWGPADARVTKVELFDSDGRSTSQARTGDEVRFRLQWASDVPVPKPVFCLAISTTDGVLVSAPTNRATPMQIETMEGEGAIDIVIPRLAILPGSYEASVSLWDRNLLHEFHHWQRAVHFDVLASSALDQGGGVLSLGAEWRDAADQGPS
jgi:ABC-type polysaccharide/polyol phosphate transport system ATPase subunit